MSAGLLLERLAFALRKVLILLVFAVLAASPVSVVLAPQLLEPVLGQRPPVRFFRQLQTRIELAA